MPSEVPVSVIEAFLREIDSLWAPRANVRLQVIGSTALMLQASYQRGTKDSDVLETASLGDDVRHTLLELAGPGTAVHRRHGLYIDVVPNGLPFLPQAPAWHPAVALNASLVHLEIDVLDVVDVVVSKLKRFNANDASDIAAMIDLGLAPHDILVRRFELAVDVFAYDARADELPRYAQHSNRVERDEYGVPETTIDLPDWT